ncbi:hypothetical protein Clacol_001264 [Clathrus columnatus]|uniref:LysM domain-containing protein n=1 Tax=Clathrus columnatus TaxID=1419009 RepID=A0AAV4ZYT4_9AGAM|nr:hypothetical protein Clacol_001264 [Clathrus columnatus]
MPRFNLHLLAVVALSALATASPLRNYVRDTVTIPSNVAPGTITSGCTEFHTVSGGETCNIVEAEFGITDAAFRALNPEINSGCSNLIAGLAYCVQATAAPTVPPNVANGTIINGCTQFFTIPTGATCAGIESTFGISDALFHALNPEINSLCTNLIAGDAYCVAGSPPTTVPIPSNVAPGTITAGCTQFATIQFGDTCMSVEATFGITSALFTKFNPEVNAQCTNLIAGDAYCVGGSA